MHKECINKICIGAISFINPFEVASCGAAEMRGNVAVSIRDGDKLPVICGLNGVITMDKEIDLLIPSIAWFRKQSTCSN